MPLITKIKCYAKGVKPAVFGPLWTQLLRDRPGALSTRQRGCSQILEDGTVIAFRRDVASLPGCRHDLFLDSIVMKLG